MKRFSVSRKRKLSISIALASLAISAGEASAQNDDSRLETQVEEITVTGSLIARPADRPQPVAIMDQQEIDNQQRVTLTEVVRDMPQISSANTTNNWTAATNSINLRGLGSRSTLILLNGQRQTIDANSGSQVDINNLAPSIMVERLELVLDGASALYGSDAVAGVANFITRNSFEGMELKLTSQHAEAQSSVPEMTAAGIFGVQSASSGLVMSLEYMRRAEAMNVEDIRSQERRATGLSTALYNPGTYGALGPVPEGDVRVQDGWFADPLCGSPEIGGEEANVITDKAGARNLGSDGLPSPGDPFCRGSLTHARSIIPEMERFTGMSVFTHDFGGDWLRGFYAEGSFAHTDTRAGYGTGVPLLALPEVNAVLPWHNPGVQEANRVYGDAFPAQDYRNIYTRILSPLEGDVDARARQWTYRTAFRLDGDIGTSGWDWRLNGTWSHNNQSDTEVDTITDRYARAIRGFGGPACKWDFVEGAEQDANGHQAGEGPCMYWNPMGNRFLAEPGDPYYNDPEVLEWMLFAPTTEGESDLYTLEAVATGELFELPGGRTGFAVGAQYRRQTLAIDYDAIAKDGGYGFSPQVLQGWDAKRETDAVFAEMVLYPTDTLELDIAARYEDTNGIASTEPKVSALWHPTDDFWVRASAGSSFRLASENQMQGISGGAVSRATIGGEVTQATGLAVGNPDLQPEESDNWTLGFTWDINDSLSLDMTYWYYDFTNLVTSTDPNDTLLDDISDGFIDNTEANPLFPGRPNEVCEVTGRWDPDSGNPLPSGCVTGFDIRIFNSSFINQNAVETSGVDFSIDYRTEMWGGDAGLRLAGAYVDSYKGTNTQGQLQDVAGTDGFNVAGVGTNPQLRANLIGDYRMGNHYFRSTIRYTDGTDVTDPNPLSQRDSESSFTQVDLVYTYDLPMLGESDFTFAVLNVGDREPPLVSNGLTTSNSGIYDPRGRMFRASITYGF